jgi:hypothetical protein
LANRVGTGNHWWQGSIAATGRGALVAEEFVISGEDDLWALLEGYLSGAKDLPPVDTIRVRRWRPHLLYFPDEPVGHSVSPSIAKAITGFHNSLSRSYAYLIYGQADARKLHSDDMDALDLRILATGGSNGLDVIGDAMDRLADAVVHKLTGRQMALLIALFLLLHFSTTVTADWIAAEHAEKAHEADIAERIKLSEQETKRMQMLKEALDRNPGIKPMASIADEGRPPLVRTVLAYDRGKVLGTEITRRQASVIVSKEKAAGKGERMDGRFEVVELDVENPEGFMGTLKDIKTQKEIRVAINLGELPESDKKALFYALEEKTIVEALVNAWIVNGKVAYASVVRAELPKP